MFEGRDDSLTDGQPVLGALLDWTTSKPYMLISRVTRFVLDSADMDGRGIKHVMTTSHGCLYPAR